MNFTVIGVGAIGGVMGAGLAKQGLDVTLVDRADGHVAAINTAGVTLEAQGNREAIPARAVTPDRLRGPLDVVLIAVKSQDTRGALELITPLLTEASIVVSVQNGFNYEVIAEAIGPERTIGAFVNFQASYLGPGVIGVGRRGSLYIGEMDGRLTPRLGVLRDIFDKIRPTTATENIHGLLWSKLAYGAILTSTALVDTPALEVMERYPTLMGSLSRETLGVARAVGVTPEAFDVFDPLAMEAVHSDEGAFRAAYERILQSWRERPIKHTGIWRDLVVRKRKTEVPWEAGEVVNRAHKYGVSVPLNTCLTRQISEIEVGKRLMGWHNLEELQAINEASRNALT